MSSSPQVVEFKEEGVTVMLPWQGRESTVQKVAPDSEPFYNPNNLTDKVIIRLVIILEIIDTETAQKITSFDPAMILTVKYTLDDVEVANNNGGTAENLALAQYDHEKDVLIPMETVIDPEKMTGTVHVTSLNSHIPWVCCF
jgi:hypothetical protein